jgi:hypothetical protein
MNAYDYRNQKWITGEAARLELIRQAQECIEVLQSPQGERFLYSGKPEGRPATVKEAILLKQAEIAELMVA